MEDVVPKKQNNRLVCCVALSLAVTAACDTAPELENKYSAGAAAQAVMESTWIGVGAAPTVAQKAVVLTLGVLGAALVSGYCVVHADECNGVVLTAQQALEREISPTDTLEEVRQDLSPALHGAGDLNWTVINSLGQGTLALRAHLFDAEQGLERLTSAINAVDIAGEGLWGISGPAQRAAIEQELDALSATFQSIGEVRIFATETLYAGVRKGAFQTLGNKVRLGNIARLSEAGAFDVGIEYRIARHHADFVAVRQALNGVGAPDDLTSWMTGAAALVEHAGQLLETLSTESIPLSVSEQGRVFRLFHNGYFETQILLAEEAIAEGDDSERVEELDGLVASDNALKRSYPRDDPWRESLEAEDIDDVRDRLNEKIETLIRDQNLPVQAELEAEEAIAELGDDELADVSTTELTKRIRRARRLARVVDAENPDSVAGRWVKEGTLTKSSAKYYPGLRQRLLDAADRGAQRRNGGDPGPDPSRL
jgi:hypothetical protein